ncbi:MAG TPA: hypothetical protein VGJ94_08750 [Syntrophorhabdaceae bacterium]
MKRIFFGIGAVLFLFFFYAGTGEAKQSEALKASYLKLPLSFVQNDGQQDAKILFYEQGGGHATAFTREGISLSLAKASKAGGGKVVTLTPVDHAAFTVSLSTGRRGGSATSPAPIPRPGKQACPLTAPSSIKGVTPGST